MNHPHEQQAAAMARAGELPDGEQLRECINSGQVSAAQVVAHAEAGELQPEAIGKIFCYDPITKKPKIEWFRRPGDIGTKLFTEEQINAALAAERAEVARLRDALERIIKSRDERAFTKEEFRTDEHLPDGYWSPAASMVDSAAIAHARDLLTAPGEKHE